MCVIVTNRVHDARLSAVFTAACRKKNTNILNNRHKIGLWLAFMAQYRTFFGVKKCSKTCIKNAKTHVKNVKKHV